LTGRVDGLARVSAGPPGPPPAYAGRRAASRLVRRGLRTQLAGLTTELQGETGDPSAAITPPEVPILLDPRQRRALRVAAFRRHGSPAYRNLRRLHAAQLDLAAHRWHRARGESTDGHDHLTALRERVRHHKYRHAALTAARSCRCRQERAAVRSAMRSAATAEIAGRSR
jgi:hypothetical protein